MALSRPFKEDRLVLRENQSFRYLCYQSVCLSVCLSVFLSVFLSVCLSVCLSETKLTANLLIFLDKKKKKNVCNAMYSCIYRVMGQYIYRSTFLRFELSVYLSTYLPTYLLIYLFTYIPTYTYLPTYLYLPT